MQVFLTEGDFVIPATRLSDGTLRYLCLLAILCDRSRRPSSVSKSRNWACTLTFCPRWPICSLPRPPRTQLIVTTHSDLLVDAMSERPNAVVVCEKHDGQTEMQRLDPAALAVWLTKYRLGQSGHTGNWEEHAGEKDNLPGRRRRFQKSTARAAGKAFANYWNRVVFVAVCPAWLLVVDEQLFDDFQTEHAQQGRADYVAMLIDSETDSVADVEATWTHLATHEGWQQPAGAEDEQVLFMTTCMESWIVADRAALAKHWSNPTGKCAAAAFANLEERRRDDVQNRLVHATRNCSNAYAKGKRSFEVLEKLDPATLTQQLPSFARVRRILNDKL